MKIYIPYSKYNGGKGFFLRRLYESFRVLEGCEPKENSDDFYDVAIHLAKKDESVKAIKHCIRMDGVIHNEDEDYIRQNKTLSREIDKCDAIIYQSNFCKLMTNRYIKISRIKKDCIIPNGSSIKFYEDSGRREKKYDYVVLSYALWRPHKRLKDVIESFLYSGIKDSCLYIAGNISRSGLSSEDRLKYGTIKNVVFLGELSQQDLVSFLSISDVFIHLSWIDWCPNSVVEALCHGVPVVCNNVGGTRELIKDGCGIICDIDQEYDMSPCHLYSPPPIDYAKVSEAISFFHKNRNRVFNNKHVDILTVSEKYLDFIKTLI